MYYNLVYSTEPSKLGVYLVKSTESAIPDKSLTDLVPSSDNNQKTSVKIMTRATPSPSAGVNSNNSISNTNNINSNPSPIHTSTEDKEDKPGKSEKSGKSLEEREQAYLEARSRIFMSNTPPSTNSVTPSTSVAVDDPDNKCVEFQSRTPENETVEDEPFGPDDIPRDLSRLPGYQKRGVAAPAAAGDINQYAMPYMVPNAQPTQAHVQAQAQVQAQIQAQAQAQAQAAIAASTAALSAQSAATGQFWNPWMSPNVFMPQNPALLASTNTASNDTNPIFNTGGFGFPSATSTPQYRPNPQGYMYTNNAGNPVRPGQQRPPRMARPPNARPQYSHPQQRPVRPDRSAGGMGLPNIDGLSLGGLGGGRGGLTPSPQPPSNNAKNVASSGIFNLDPQLIQQKQRGSVSESADETSSNHSSNYTNSSNTNTNTTSRRSTRRRKGTAQSAQSAQSVHPNGDMTMSNNI